MHKALLGTGLISPFISCHSPVCSLLFDSPCRRLLADTCLGASDCVFFHTSSFIGWTPIYISRFISKKYFSVKCPCPLTEKDSYTFLGTHMAPSIYYLALQFLQYCMLHCSNLFSSLFSIILLSTAEVWARGLFVLFFIMTGTMQNNVQKVKMGLVCLRIFAEAPKAENDMCQVY